MFFFSVDHTIGELGFLLVDQSKVIVSGGGAPYKVFNTKKEKDPDQTMGIRAKVNIIEKTGVWTHSVCHTV